MAKVLVDETNLAHIGAAIRTKRGVASQYYPSEMASAILDIQNIRPTGAVNIRSNGIHNVTDYSQATVNVPNTYSSVDAGKVVIGASLVSQASSRVTANGTYDTTSKKRMTVDVKPKLESLVASANSVYTPRSGVDGFSKVTVNVSAPEPTLEDLSVTSNGTYAPSEGVDGFGNVVVDVPSGTDTDDATLSDGAQMRSGITAYASGSKIVGTMPDYNGSVNGQSGSIGGYGVYEGDYFVAPSTSEVTVPTRHKVLMSDIIIASYSVPSAVVTLQDILIESNGTYHASSGYDGFGNVVVDVPDPNPPTLVEGYFSEGGTHYASDIEVDGWSVVTIDVPSGSLGSVEISANGVYQASDVDGWSMVTVSVPTSEAVLSAKTFSSNGVYNASEYNADGFSKVTVNVNFSVTSAVINGQAAFFAEVASISASAFKSASDVTVVSFPTVLAVGESAFYSCPNLATVNLPSCRTIGNYAFRNCSSLSEVNLPMVESIGNSVFSSCNIESLELPSCVTIGWDAFTFNGAMTNASLPLCEKLYGDAFASCSSLSTFYAPNITKLGGGTFAYCRSLQSIDFPNCSDAGGGEFRQCINLQSVTLGKISSAYREVFSTCTNLTYVSLPMCETIGSFAFYKCGVSVLDLPQLKTIECVGLFGASNLQEVSFPELVTLSSGWYTPYYVGESSHYSGTFGSCKISSIFFPKCKSVGSAVFSNCSMLQTVSLPACEFIGSYAFEECVALQSVYLMGSSVCRLDGVLAETYCFAQNFSIFVPSSLYDTYVGASNWSGYSTYIASL